MKLSPCRGDRPVAASAKTGPGLGMPIKIYLAVGQAPPVPNGEHPM